MKKLVFGLAVVTGAAAWLLAADTTISIATPMAAPKWAQLERQLLADSVPAAREFYNKYFDNRGYLLCFVRWGATDGADDAFENFNHWPELHSLGASDELMQMFMKGHEGLIKQYSEAKTVETPAGRDGIYVKEFDAQQDWQHHGEGLQLFNRMALSAPRDPKYLERVRRFAGLYMGEDPDAPNYDPQHKLIRSMLNGSKGPLLRKATAIDWVGDPFDVSKFVGLHGEHTFEQFLQHYQEYSDVVGDHFLNLASTTLATNAYFATHDPKYKKWVIDYVDAWMDRMKQNNGILPSFVDLDGTIGGKDGKWWNNAYGWGFSPVNPVTGKRENRNRIERAIIGFNDALFLTGDMKYVEAWRSMTAAVNSHARTVNGKTEYPTMYGADGWYGWQDHPWNVDARQVWYFTLKPEDAARIGSPREPLGHDPWVEYLTGKNPAFPETALAQDLAAVKKHVQDIRADKSTPDTRLADNMLDLNPVTITALVHLAQGALEPLRDGDLFNARVRYFDPARKRTGLPEDVAALVSALTDTGTTLTLVNTGTQPRTVIVQGGEYAEHQILSVTAAGKTTPVNATTFTVTLAPGAGGQLTLNMKRFNADPTVRYPWDR